MSSSLCLSFVNRPGSHVRSGVALVLAQQQADTAQRRVTLSIYTIMNRREFTSTITLGLTASTPSTLAAQTLLKIGHSAVNLPR